MKILIIFILLSINTLAMAHDSNIFNHKFYPPWNQNQKDNNIKSDHVLEQEDDNAGCIPATED